MQNRSSPPSLFVKFKLILVAALMLSHFSAYAIAWDKMQYNPKPAEGDVILPMPCDGAMVFRKVETETSNTLGDQMVRLGDLDSKVGYLENSIETPIAGAFSGEKPLTRYYLLEKYEVTQLQYQSVMSPKCPGINDDSNFPQADLNWFEAVEFANKYSLWLFKKAPGKLPVNGEDKGFVRLPTEAEWEFAVRGGLQTSYDISLFQAKTFPMPDGGINKYAWCYSKGAINNGKAQPIGLLNPNPLGFHDILGNLDEIVFESFHMTLHSRLHGQAGAYVVRGGNFLLDSESIRSSYRQEVPYYKDGDLRKNKTTGLRLAVASAVLNNKNKREIQSKWYALSVTEKGVSSDLDLKAVEPVSTPISTRVADLEAQLKQCQSATPGAVVSSCPELMPNLSAQPLADPLAELGDLAAKANQPALKIRLSNLQVNLAAIIELRNQKRDQAAREALRTASMICQKLHDDYVQVVKMFEERFEKKKCGSGSNDPDCPLINAKLTQFNGKIQFNKEIYADAIMKISQNYPLETLESQKNFLLAEMERKSYKDFGLFVNRFYEHVEIFHNNNKIVIEEWYGSCKSIKQ